MTHKPGEITRLLEQVRTGDESAGQRVFELAYDELRAIAAGLMKRERPDHTLQPTALVHEAAERLLPDLRVSSHVGRTYFFATAARAMRRILIDHARARNAQRRGGKGRKTPLDAVVDVVQKSSGVDLIVLDDALERLSQVCKRHADVVVLKFFGGMTMPEIAEHLDVSLSTVESDWRLARAWLSQALE